MNSENRLGYKLAILEFIRNRDLEGLKAILKPLPVERLNDAKAGDYLCFEYLDPIYYNPKPRFYRIESIYFHEKSNHFKAERKWSVRDVVFFDNYEIDEDHSHWSHHDTWSLDYNNEGHQNSWLVFPCADALSCKARVDSDQEQSWLTTTFELL